jgi:V/A-type H+-transporting ATPase subunit C
MSKSVYIGTTAAAIKGTLLGRSAVEKLAESTTLEELVNRLKGTPYSGVLSSVPKPYEARRLELSFRERLADAHYLLMSQSKEYGLISLYYMKQMAWDLKSVLKSKAMGKDGESMEYLTMHAEELVGRRDLIVRVIAARDLTEASSLLSGTEFGEDVQMAVAAFGAKGEIHIFDLYVDHSIMSKIAAAYFTNAKLYSSPRAVDVAGVGEMVALDVNAYNILSVLRAKLWRLPEEEVRGLVVPPRRNPALVDVRALIEAESVSEATKLLEGTLPWSPRTRPSDEDTIDSVEDFFIAKSIQVAKRAFVWQGLSIASALAVTKLLEFEVRNLAAIAIGIEARMDTKAVLSKLVF